MKILGVISILLTTTFLMAGTHDILKPFLVDLPGWTGGEAEGMSMDMSGMKMIQATREYAKEDQHITAVIMVSNQASANAMVENSMNIETDKGSVKTETIDGFKVVIGHDREDNESLIFISLKSDGSEKAFLSLTGKNINTDILLDLAKKFDWKKMKNTVEKM